MEKWKYPAGRFQWNGEWDAERKEAWIAAIEELPAALRGTIQDWDGARLDTPYRPGGWTVRQVVHHLADSHMNSLIRFKLALTEDEPVIKPYREDLWAELPDSRSYPVNVSLQLLEAVHSRWCALLRSMTEENYLRTFYHPESQEVVPLRRALATYAWHSVHHHAQIQALIRHKGWQ
jgi:uncharacterized damage-inducible protein DinB